MPLYNPNNLGGNISPVQIVVDIGQTPVYTISINIVDLIVNSNSRILVWQDASPLIDRPADENEMDALTFSATPLNGSFNLIITAVPGPIVGHVLVDYIVV